MRKQRVIYLKTLEEIERLRRANLLVGRTHGELARHIRPGLSTKALDKIAYEFIRDHGAEPAFLGYSGFPASVCTSINEYVVHGIPSERDILNDGDILSLDIGVYLDGFVGDSAFTYPVGEISEEKRALLRTTLDSLEYTVDSLQVGQRIGDIGHMIQSYCEKRGYSVVREFTGHGIGKEMHEAPNVPNYGRKGTGIVIEEGLCICIEPMINLGSRRLEFSDDGWTVWTIDRKPSAHFEHCIAMVKGRAQRLSTFDFIYDVLGKEIF